MLERETTVSVRPARSIDTRPYTITTSIAYAAARTLQELEDGDVLEVATEEYGPIEGDLRAWCRMRGHRYLGIERGPDLERHLIEKVAHAEAGEQSLAFVISDAGLLKLLSPLGFALAAALEGIEVSIYFAGPAVRVLTRGFKASLPGLGRPFSMFPRRGLEKIGHVSPTEKLRELQELGAVFYACGPSMEHFKVSPDEFAFEGVIVAEYLTFMEVMSQSDMQFFLQ